MSKALRKGQEERYQTARDLLIDLRSLKHELEFEAEVERSTSPDTSVTSEKPADTESFGPTQHRSAAGLTKQRKTIQKRTANANALNAGS